MEIIHNRMVQYVLLRKVWNGKPINYHAVGGVSTSMVLSRPRDCPAMEGQGVLYIGNNLFFPFDARFAVVTSFFSSPSSSALVGLGFFVKFTILEEGVGKAEQQWLAVLSLAIMKSTQLLLCMPLTRRSPKLLNSIIIAAAVEVAATGAKEKDLAIVEGYAVIFDGTSKVFLEIACVSHEMTAFASILALL
ncbi:hypothetical protein ACH5RR_003311 [Cinchona calisaya]|uniref:Uncharacterized protein n=1 Tax=Cinchona calisaya TaxID=153742 RepID=A0ABD3AUF3_9GENT